MTGSLQVSPSSLSVRAMLCLGRQENHMRYRPPSRRTATSKHVPRGPPRTGLFLDFTQPAAVWASGCSGKATAPVTRNPTSASNGTMLLMGVPSGRVAQALAVCNVRQGQGYDLQRRFYALKDERMSSADAE